VPGGCTPTLADVAVGRKTLKTASSSRSRLKAVERGAQSVLCAQRLFCRRIKSSNTIIKIEKRFYKIVINNNKNIDIKI
jgi:hypothetical protein